MKMMTEEQDQLQEAVGDNDTTKNNVEKEMTTAHRIYHLFVSSLLCKLVQ